MFPYTTQKCCSCFENKLQVGRLISLYSSEVPLLQTGSTTCFYHLSLAPRVHKNWFQAALTSSVIVNVFHEIQKGKQSNIKPTLSFRFSLSPVMVWMAPYQYILWKALWLVWCRPRPVPTRPQPTPSWTSTRTPTCLWEEYSALSRYLSVSLCVCIKNLSVFFAFFKISSSCVLESGRS